MRVPADACTCWPYLAPGLSVLHVADMGATSMRHTYDVAIWRSSFGSAFPLVGYAEAEDGFTAVLCLMAECSVRRVIYAAARPVRLVGGRSVSVGPIERIERAIMLP